MRTTPAPRFLLLVFLKNETFMLVLSKQNQSVLKNMCTKAYSGMQ